MPLVRIARHGETTWNAVGRYQGRLDTPLSALGQAQAQALGSALGGKGIERIISSPLARCIDTATPLSLLTGIRIEREPLLLEIAHGTWEGRYRDEIAASEPDLYRRWREDPPTVRFEGGESLRDVYERWRQFVGTVSVKSDTLLITHDVVVRIALLERTGRDLHQLRAVQARNACYAQFDAGDGKWRLQHECVCGHLGNLAADIGRQAL